MDSIKQEIKWKNELRPISKLKPFPHNPRTLSKEQAQQLQRSIEKFGYVETVAINLDDMIIAGHMRIKTLQRLGYSTIEVRVPDRLLDEEEVKEYVIRSNKNVGDWDFDILGNNFDLNDLHEFGFSGDELGIFLDAEEGDSKDSEECEKCQSCGQKIKDKKK